MGAVLDAPVAACEKPVALAWVEALGYSQPRQIPGVGICAIRPFLFTGGLVVGIGPVDYSGRYCYGTVREAVEALAAWSGDGDPPGDWIKFKGLSEERLGPGCT